MQNNSLIGHVYVSKYDDHPQNIYKIGATQTTVKNRLSQLHICDLHTCNEIMSWKVSDCFKLESMIHLDLKEFRIRRTENIFTLN